MIYLGIAFLAGGIFCAGWALGVYQTKKYVVSHLKETRDLLSFLEDMEKACEKASKNRRI